MGVAHQTSTQK